MKNTLLLWLLFGSIAACGGKGTDTCVGAECDLAAAGGSAGNAAAGGGVSAGGTDPNGIAGMSSTLGGAPGGGASAGGAPSGDTCDPACQAPNGGVTIGCEKRFLYGVNYAWGSFGSDFGNATRGVNARRTTRLTTLQDMRANGVDVVRWWVFPNFTGGGVSFDANGAAIGLVGSAAADIAAALDLAAQAGVHIQFTLFSFDDFKTTLVQNLAPIISDPTKLQALLDHVVTPFVAEVNKSANADRVISWDVINEPEWAISGNDGSGDQAFTPQTTVTTVSYATMRAFVSATADALHAASDRPVTVGSAAIKWAKAWAGIGDFYTFHMYDWVNTSFPYTRPLSAYGVTDKPVVMGEFPIQGLTGVPYATFVKALFDSGYSGAMAWAVNDVNFPWAPNKANVKAFADQTGCAVQY